MSISELRAKLDRQLNQPGEFREFRSETDNRSLNAYERQVKAAYDDPAELKRITDVFERIRWQLDQADRKLGDGVRGNDAEGFKHAQRAAELLLRELSVAADRGVMRAKRSASAFETMFDLPAAESSAASGASPQTPPANERPASSAEALPAPQTFGQIILASTDPAVRALAVTVDQAQGELTELQGYTATITQLASLTPEGQSAAAPWLAAAKRLLNIAGFAIGQGLADEANAIMTIARANLVQAVGAAARSSVNGAVLLQGADFKAADTIFGQLNADATPTPLNWNEILQNTTVEQWASAWIMDPASMKQRYGAIVQWVNDRLGADDRANSQIAEINQLANELNAAIDAYDHDRITKLRDAIGRRVSSAASAVITDDMRHENRAKVRDAERMGADISNQAARIEQLLTSSRTAFERLDINGAFGDLREAQRLLGVAESKLIPFELNLVRSYIKQATQLAGKVGAGGRMTQEKLKAVEMFANLAKYALSIGKSDEAGALINQARAQLDVIASGKLTRRATGEYARYAPAVERLVANVRRDSTPSRVQIGDGFIESLVPDNMLVRLENRGARLFNQMSNLNRRGIDVRNVLAEDQRNRLTQLDNFVERQLRAAMTDIGVYDIVGVNRRFERVADAIAEAERIVEGGERRSGRQADRIRNAADADESRPIRLSHFHRRDDDGPRIPVAREMTDLQRLTANISTQQLMNIYKSSSSAADFVSTVNDLVNPNFSSYKTYADDDVSVNYIGIEDAFIGKLMVSYLRRENLIFGRKDHNLVSNKLLEQEYKTERFQKFSDRISQYDFDFDDKDKILDLVGDYLFGAGWDKGVQRIVHEGAGGRVRGTDFDDTIIVKGRPRDEIDIDAMAGDDIVSIAAINRQGSRRWLNDATVQLGDGADTLVVNANLRKATIDAGEGNDRLSLTSNLRLSDIDLGGGSNRLIAIGEFRNLNVTGDSSVVALEGFGSGIDIELGGDTNTISLNGAGRGFRDVKIELGDADKGATVSLAGRGSGVDVNLTNNSDQMRIEGRWNDLSIFTDRGTNDIITFAEGFRGTGINIIDEHHSSVSAEGTKLRDQDVVIFEDAGVRRDGNTYTFFDKNGDVRFRVTMGDENADGDEIEIVMSGGETLRYEKPDVRGPSFGAILFQIVKLAISIAVPPAGAAIALVEAVIRGDALGIVMAVAGFASAVLTQLANQVRNGVTVVSQQFAKDFASFYRIAGYAYRLRDGIDVGDIVSIGGSVIATDAPDGTALDVGARAAPILYNVVTSATDGFQAEDIGTFGNAIIDGIRIGNDISRFNSPEAVEQTIRENIEANPEAFDLSTWLAYGELPPGSTFGLVSAPGLNELLRYDPNATNMLFTTGNFSADRNSDYLPTRQEDNSNSPRVEQEITFGLTSSTGLNELLQYNPDAANNGLFRLPMANTRPIFDVTNIQEFDAAPSSVRSTPSGGGDRMTPVSSDQIGTDRDGRGTASLNVSMTELADNPDGKNVDVSEGKFVPSSNTENAILNMLREQGYTVKPGDISYGTDNNKGQIVEVIFPRGVVNVVRNLSNRARNLWNRVTGNGNNQERDYGPDSAYDVQNSYETRHRLGLPQNTITIENQRRAQRAGYRVDPNYLENQGAYNSGAYYQSPEYVNYFGQESSDWATQQAIRQRQIDYNNSSTLTLTVGGNSSTVRVSPDRRTIYNADGSVLFESVSPLTNEQIAGSDLIRSRLGLPRVSPTDDSRSSPLTLTLNGQSATIRISNDRRTIYGRDGQVIFESATPLSNAQIAESNIIRNRVGLGTGQNGGFLSDINIDFDTAAFDIGTETQRSSGSPFQLGGSTSLSNGGLTDFSVNFDDIVNQSIDFMLQPRSDADNMRLANAAISSLHASSEEYRNWNNQNPLLFRALNSGGEICCRVVWPMPRKFTSRWSMARSVPL